MAWGVATRGQGKLSGESEAKAPEREPNCAKCVCNSVCHCAVTCEFVVMVYNHAIMFLSD